MSGGGGGEGGPHICILTGVELLVVVLGLKTLSFVALRVFRT